MKAVVWHGKEDVRVDEVPDPKVQEPTDAVIRVTSTAVCGSDLHLYAKLSPIMRSGDIIGHEPMGIVEEVGSEVSHIKPGDRVVLPFNISCGHCFMCEQQLYSQCETTRDTGKLARAASLLGRGKGASLFGYTHVYGAVPGGQAEYLRVPQAHFGPIKVPEEAGDAPDERFLYLSDVLPTAWQAVEYADVPPGGSVAVFGLGPIGQMCCRIALHRGAGRVFGIDCVPERLSMAARWGAETVDFSAVDSVRDIILALTEGRGADVGIDAVGMEASGSAVDSVLQATKLQLDKAHALRECASSIRRGGTLSISGVYTGPIQAFPLGDLFDMQLQVRMGQANVWRWVNDIMPLLTGDGDPLGTESLKTHTMALKDAPRAYRIFQKKEDGAIKCVLKP
ncbi:Threonine dehydrogenase and related Zn-dependent dehydrogenase [Rubrobacter radiotolerans]|uniref:Threonine dehydrogenase and related Zn-dependent dehydrogenase n=1 Tax=Rubrobacter radiotolerans TaxID=42256 RepID=A0A023X173_RUBRA|nr:zinc-dependent alcohol dehydrogenase [Rubrobacter radiotolerans]AHY46222.1 Threonine dehydrogenase and related Zn-dependent dehydrogenase [Rubrobacter radiotolerans]MDX5893630.1 zinc-dependent alcohol dehydrogenase [Rubrobacter radiotolerans]SMC04156.1 Threonine dehydrogenase [Rubrobacter radiotolerans DSM 5868]